MTIRTRETFWPMRRTRRIGMAMVATFALAGIAAPIVVDPGVPPAAAVTR
ncbi:MAG: hypothetical protein ACR2GO_03260 [Candidatus Limnocylindria bacterium]